MRIADRHALYHAVGGVLDALVKERLQFLPAPSSNSGAHPGWCAC